MPHSLPRRTRGALTLKIHRFGRFIVELVRAQHRDRIAIHAGALAYSALLSMVPLFTVVLISSAGARPELARRLVDALTQVLPFSPTQVQTTLRELAERTVRLGAIATTLSFLAAINMLYQVEEVINAVWGLPSRRKLRWRLAGIVAVLVWGPLLLLVLFSGLYWFSSQPWYPRVAWLGRPLPAVFAIAALTLIYRLVPHTRVPWRAALAGAAVATTALLAIHVGFQEYLDVASEINVIYGSFSIAFFFLVSLYLFWLAILLGVEASWVVGHVPPAPPPPDAKAVMSLLLSAERDGRVLEKQARNALGERASDVLERLRRSPEILAECPDGLRLARPADEITVAEVLARLAPDGVAEAADAGATLAALAKEPSSGGVPSVTDGGEKNG
ncbi:MAG: YhjD/YihY/BrkB family envelope integrity protein [Acidobacteriota bacterium]